MILAGNFREDLYHRLSVFPIHLPPLRERPADIAPMAESLLRRAAADLGRPPLRLSDEAHALLVSAELRGNIRELKNVLERAAILADGDVVRAAHIMLEPPMAKSNGVLPAMASTKMEDLERAAIMQALGETSGNRRLAAERLGIGVRTLYDKLKRYGLG
jgi:two-component system response regulator AtoC